MIRVALLFKNKAKLTLKDSFGVETHKLDVTVNLKQSLHKDISIC